MSNIKEYVCVVCGEPVTKRKSVRYREGRACKHHEEVAELAEFQKEVAFAKEKSREVRVGNRITDRIRRTQETTEWGKSHCWLCKSVDLQGNEYWSKILDVFGTGMVEVENLFKHEKISGKKLLIQFPHAGTKMFKKIDSKMSRSASMSGYAIVCPDCARGYKLDPDFLISAMANVDPDVLESINLEVVDKIEELICLMK